AYARLAPGQAARGWGELSGPVVGPDLPGQICRAARLRRGDAVPGRHARSRAVPGAVPADLRGTAGPVPRGRLLGGLDRLWPDHLLVGLAAEADRRRRRVDLHLRLPAGSEAAAR